MMRANFFFIFFMLPFCGLVAQNPVDAKCYAEDSLFWEYSNDPTCSFVEHEIFYSSNILGPYISVGNVTDPSVESFDLSGLSILEEVFFYISTTLDCGSIEVVFSDTISSLPPNLVEISFLDVTDTGIIINWIDQLNDPNDHQYLIYRDDDGSVNEIGTVSLGNSFLDTDILPVEMAETYYVLAEDACGNVSIFDTPHSSMFLFTSFDACLNAFDVGWTLMENASLELDSLRLNIEHESGFSEFISADIDQDGLLYNVVSGSGDYCLELYAYYPNGDIATSNQICTFAATIPQLESYQISNVTNTGNSTRIDWIAEDEDAIKEFEVIGVDNDGQNVWNSGVVDFNTTVNPFIEDPVNWEESAGLVNYMVTFKNNCDFSFSTEAFSNIYLTMTVDVNGTAFFEWQSQTPNYIVPSEYRLYKVEGQNAQTLIQNFNTSTNGYYQLSADELREQDLRFRVERIAELEDVSSGQITTISSFSNTVQYTPGIKLVLPNAIKPNGKNTVFKPVLVSGNVQSYVLNIYDRYGQLLFESQDIEDGWKGKNELEFFPVGVYQYTISVIDVQGVEYEYAGVLTLVR